MRKLFIAPLTAALLLATMAIPVIARGPACVDLLSQNPDTLVLSDAAYDGSLVAARIFLADDQCRQATYTIYVLDDEGDSTTLVTESLSGDSAEGAQVEFFVNATASDSDVCVYVESSIGRHVFDRAPSDGCVTRFDDGSSPGGGKGF